jgi:hypothetical protein
MNNKRNAFPVFIFIVLALLLILALSFAFGSGNTDTSASILTQWALQRTQMALNLTLTAHANGGAIVPPPATPPPATPPPATFPPGHPITLTPTFTPTVTSTRIPSGPGPIDFFDNFDNGFDPRWQVTGEWLFTNGQPVYTGRPRGCGMLLTGAQNWDNYAIEFDRLTDFDLMFGYKDNQNSFDMNLGWSTLFYETYNGNKSEVNTSRRNGVPSGKTRLEVRGNKLKFFTINSFGDQNLIYDMQLARPMNGQVGFETCNTSGAVLDNFKVTSIH